MSMQMKWNCINRKRILWYMLFGVSLINSAALTGWTLVLLLWSLTDRKEQAKIQALLMIQLRSLINPGIAAPYAGVASISKWCAVFIIAILLLGNHGKRNSHKIRNIYILFGVYGVFLIIASWFVSSFPTVASFKVISYLLPFLAIIKGICDTSQEAWMETINKSLGILLLGSAVLLPVPAGYLRNGHAFQGFLNHPNVYGVMLAVFLAGYLYLKTEYGVKEIIMSSLVFGLAILSESRTGMFSCIMAVVLFILSKDIRKKRNTVVVAVLGVCILGGILVISEPVKHMAASLIFKGYAGNLLFSRGAQMLKNIDRFFVNPLLGTGFNVPYVPGVYSIRFSFQLVVENGNLILAILGDSGVIGLALFGICYFYIFQAGWGNKLVVFAIPFIVSMGEQSFFSTNNFGMILYLYIAIYLADGLALKAMGQERATRKFCFREAMNETISYGCSGEDKHLDKAGMPKEAIPGIERSKTQDTVFDF